MTKKLKPEDMPKLKKIVAHTDKVISALDEVAREFGDPRASKLIKAAIDTLEVAKRDAYSLQAIAIMAGGQDQAEDAFKFRMCQELADRTLAARKP